MKIIAFNGSARKDGNTAIMLGTALAELEEEGFKTELIQLAGQAIRGCTACGACFKNKDGHCVITNDVANMCIDRMREADGIIIGSPTYFADVTTETKALIDRAGFVARANGCMFRRKAGAAVVTARRAGAIHAFDTINHFFTIEEMIIVGSTYWNLGIGRAPGEVEKDEEGLNTMRTLGANMAWLLKKLGNKE
ncbi:flavodoxin family protein [bacterium]|nr:flavodoxin family protein [bacterium]